MSAGRSALPQVPIPHRIPHLDVEIAVRNVQRGPDSSSSVHPKAALRNSKLTNTFTGTLGREGVSAYNTAKASSSNRQKNSR